MASPTDPAATSSNPTPTCSRCGNKGVWYASSNQWGCDNCQMLPMQQGHAPMAQNPFGAPPQMRPVGQAYVPPPVSCPRCGSFATFYAQTNQYGCDKCQMPVQPNPYANPMMMRSGSEAQSDAGMVVLKVVGTIILIIILTAIRVSLR